jgi:type II secretory pathway component PulF
MPVYECRVRSKSGESRQLSIEAPSVQAALERLHREGHFVLTVRERRQPTARRGIALLKRARLDELLYVNLVQAAEASGNLDEVLKRAADYLSESLTCNGA